MKKSIKYSLTLDVELDRVGKRGPFRIGGYAVVVSGRALVQTLEDQAPVGHDHSVPQVLAHLNALLNIDRFICFSRIAKR